MEISAHETAFPFPDRSIASCSCVRLYVLEGNPTSIDVAREFLFDMCNLLGTNGFRCGPPDRLASHC